MGLRFALKEGGFSKFLWWSISPLPCSELIGIAVVIGPRFARARFAGASSASKDFRPHESKSGSIRRTRRSARDAVLTRSSGLNPVIPLLQNSLARCGAIGSAVYLSQCKGFDVRSGRTCTSLGSPGTGKAGVSQPASTGNDCISPLRPADSRSLVVFRLDLADGSAAS